MRRVHDPQRFYLSGGVPTPGNGAFTRGGDAPAFATLQAGRDAFCAAYLTPGNENTTERWRVTPIVGELYEFRFAVERG